VIAGVDVEEGVPGEEEGNVQAKMEELEKEGGREGE